MKHSMPPIALPQENLYVAALRLIQANLPERVETTTGELYSYMSNLSKTKDQILTISQHVEAFVENSKPLLYGVEDVIEEVIQEEKASVDKKIALSSAIAPKVMRLLDMRHEDIINRGTPGELLNEIMADSEGWDNRRAECLYEVSTAWVSRELGREISYSSMAALKKLIQECIQLSGWPLTDDDRDRLNRWHSYIMLLTAHKNAEEQEIRLTDLIAHHSTLEVARLIFKSMGQASMTREEIMEEMHLGKHVVQEALSKLEASGYVTFRENRYKRTDKIMIIKAK